MNIYKLSQSINNKYDTFDAIIVVAENEEEAKKILPHKFKVWDGYNYSDWARPEDITVRLIGKAKKDIQKGCILASFRAG